MERMKYMKMHTACLLKIWNFSADVPSSNHIFSLLSILYKVLPKFSSNSQNLFIVPDNLTNSSRSLFFLILGMAHDTEVTSCK